MLEIHKKVYLTIIVFIKVVVKQDPSSLKKNVSVANFYETLKATISKSSLGACFSITLPKECWNKSLSIKDICEYKTKHMKWKGMVYVNIYAHLKDFNIVILQNTGKKQPLWEARRTSATKLKIILLKVISGRCC